MLILISCCLASYVLQKNSVTFSPSTNGRVLFSNGRYPVAAGRLRLPEIKICSRNPHLWPHIQLDLVEILRNRASTSCTRAFWHFLNPRSVRRRARLCGVARRGSRCTELAYLCGRNAVFAIPSWYVQATEIGCCVELLFSRSCEAVPNILHPR